MVQWFGVESSVDVGVCGGLGDFSDKIDWIRGGFCRLEYESGVMERASGSRAIGSKVGMTVVGAKPSWA